ncbi:putative nucleoside diphosphate kinase [Candidatus Tremblaya phenacola PAVE]|nr:putative nucleoside diphosphate kinase [Candidatus Tremblaya phenacola PAVE]
MSDRDYTFTIIKPDGIKRKLVGKINSILEEFGIVMSKASMTKLGLEEARKFYAEHQPRPFYNGLLSFMTSGPLLMLILKARNATKRMRRLLGNTNPNQSKPGTIRFLFGSNTQHNVIHNSDSNSSAKKELAFGASHFQLEF